MDTLLSSTSLSTLSVSGLRHHPKAHHLKTHFPPRLPISPTANPQKTPNKAAAAAATFSPHRNNHPPLTTFNPSPQSANPPPEPQSCRNPTTGYAAALLDVAKTHAALASVNRDVRRLYKWFGRPEITNVVSSPNLGKGEILREMVTRGNFHKYLVKLVNLLVGKRGFEVGMLGEVLMEFTRIYGELLMGGPSGAADGPVVLVSPGVRMGRDQIYGVSERIRQISGAVKAITVRQLAGDHRLPAFAV
ncbi:ATPase- F1 complex- OSCP/delta subunit protein [Striga hermonthica]|uniref:ATPase- F1 complex- OSCP/delta subunit protein n=1 Tax=Striga hermonthica TaxID=68872 RepID=A0A9N7MWR7_STRHE|nr:ATPase- F1 complex- OSCP/delta subunit protein [Striga hermonthica]